MSQLARRTSGGVIALGFVGALGCGGMSDPRHPTGGQTIAIGQDAKALHIANLDQGTVSSFDVASESIVGELPVGLEPTRIARAGERVFVTLRGERAVAVLLETDGHLSLETKISVGAEPFGVVANEGGDRVYVSSSLSDRVDEIDGESLEILRSWTVAGEPRGLALHPSGDALYVAATFGGGLTYIDLTEDNEQRVVYPGRPSDPSAFGVLNTTVRITGDPVTSPDGYDVAVPVMTVDPNTAIDDGLPPPSTGYYGGRFGPALEIMSVKGDGEPLEDRQREVRLFWAGGGLGYPSSVAYDPTSSYIYISHEGSEVMTVIPAVDTVGFGASVGAIGAAPFGNNGLVFTGESDAFTYGTFDRSLARLDVTRLSEGADRSDESASPVVLAQPLPTVRSIKVTEPALPVEIAEGRRLFYTTRDPEVANPLTGLSCSSCHFDGRTDGLTWTFVRGKRQTPSLAGPVSMTAPVRWEGERATVADDAAFASKNAMGGVGMGAIALTQLTAYVDFTRDTDVPMKGSTEPAVMRGKAIFERTDVGCASCHNGPRLADSEKRPMFGLANAKTRSLVGVAATAPYLHDGSAPTLRDVVATGRDGRMGNTSMLSEAEVDDLVAYLESL